MEISQNGYVVFYGNLTALCIAKLFPQQDVQSRISGGHIHQQTCGTDAQLLRILLRLCEQLVMEQAGYDQQVIINIVLKRGIKCIAFFCFLQVNLLPMQLALEQRHGFFLCG